MNIIGNVESKIKRNEKLISHILLNDARNIL